MAKAIDQYGSASQRLVRDLKSKVEFYKLMVWLKEERWATMAELKAAGINLRQFGKLSITEKYKISEQIIGGK